MKDSKPNRTLGLSKTRGSRKLPFINLEMIWNDHISRDLGSYQDFTKTHVCYFVHLDAGSKSPQGNGENSLVATKHRRCSEWENVPPQGAFRIRLAWRCNVTDIRKSHLEIKVLWRSFERMGPEDFPRNAKHDPTSDSHFAHRIPTPTLDQRWRRPNSAVGTEGTKIWAPVDKTTSELVTTYGATRYPEGRYQTWRKAASKSTINGGFSGKITPNWKVDSSKPVSISGPMWNLTHSYFAGRRKLPKLHPVEGLPVGTSSVSRRWHADKSANRSYCLNTGYGEKELDGNRLKVRSTLCVS